MYRGLIAIAAAALYLGCSSEPADCPTLPETDTSVDVEEDTDDRPDCVTECTWVGQQICLDDGRIGTCDAPEGDFCYELVAIGECPDDRVCQDGYCGEPPCQSACALDGASICTEDNRGFIVCGDYNDDGCLEFGEPILCSGREICSGGSCPVECDTSECDTVGETSCQDGGVVTCGDVDRDGCLEWSEPTSCPTGQSCVSGTCTEGSGECLLISEYVEGSGQNKAIEIYNCSSGLFSMADIGVCLIAGTSSGPPCTDVSFFTGSMSSGQVVTICHTDSDISGCDVRDDVMSFNGDERLILFHDDDGDGDFDDRNDTLLDAFGEYDWVPSSRLWENSTYRRCNPAPFNGYDRFDVLDYYTRHSEDDFSNLGRPPTLSGCP